MHSKIQLSRIIPESIPSRRKLSLIAWKITDIGLDNDQDGTIEQSFLETSCRNLEFIFHKEQTGIIFQKNESETLTFQLEWEIDQENCSITILSDYDLFRMKTKWNIRKLRYNELQLSHCVKLSDQTITVMMLMKGERIKRRTHTKQFLQMILLPLLYL
jgi:hypothetical protein